MKIKIKIILAAALLLLSGCKKNIDESSPPDGMSGAADTEFSLTTFNTNTDTTAGTAVPQAPEAESLSGTEANDTAFAEAPAASSTAAETTEKTTSVTSETEIISFAVNETTETAKKTMPAETKPAETKPVETVTAAKAAERGLDDSADICLSKLYFGMSANEAAEVIDAEIEVSTGDTEFYSNVSFDLDKSFREGYIVYGDHICQIVMNTDFMTEKEAAGLKENIMKKLNNIYGLTDSSWDVGITGNDICLVNGIITLELGLNRAGKNAMVALTLTSPKHMGSGNADKISVFPPN